MSSNVDELSTEDVSAQLRTYGTWLDQRCDVPLTGPGITVLDELETAEDVPPSRARFLAGTAAAVALIVLLAVGIGVGVDRTDRRQLQSGPAGDLATATDDRDTPTSGERGQQRSAAGSDGIEAASAGVTGGVEALDDESPLFLSPSDGSVLDLDVGTTLEATPVPRAVAYAFGGWQSGQEVMSVTGASPVVVVPSRLADGAVTAEVAPGGLTLIVTAIDAGGNVVGRDEIDVVVADGAPGTAPGITSSNPFPTDPWPTSGPGGRGSAVPVGDRVAGSLCCRVL